ncbi:MAG: hypothetical protein ACI4JT_07805 [Oscillospiraceae bacterium]
MENEVFQKRAIFRVRCPKNRPRLPQSIPKVKLGSKAGEATLVKSENSVAFVRGFARAFSAVRCRRKCNGFAETPNLFAKPAPFAKKPCRREDLAAAAPVAREPPKLPENQSCPKQKAAREIEPLCCR